MQGHTGGDGIASTSGSTWPASRVLTAARGTRWIGCRGFSLARCRGAAIIDRYRDRLTYAVSEPDDGQTDALIKGFARATGDILAWLNSDDLYEPSTLRDVAAYFSTHPETRFVYGNALWVSRTGERLRAKKEIPFNRFISLHAGNYVPQPSAFWRRDLYQEVGGLDARLELAMDADLWLRFSKVTKPAHVRRIWSRMRSYPEQKNERLRDVSNIEGKEIEGRYIRTSGYAWEAKRRLARAMRIGWKAGIGCYW